MLTFITQLWFTLIPFRSNSHTASTTDHTSFKTKLKQKLKSKTKSKSKSKSNCPKQQPLLRNPLSQSFQAFNNTTISSTTSSQLVQQEFCPFESVCKLYRSPNVPILPNRISPQVISNTQTALFILATIPFPYSTFILLSIYSYIIMEDEQVEFSRCLSLSRSFNFGRSRDNDDAIWFENFGHCSNYSLSNYNQYNKYAPCVLDIDGEPMSAPLLTLDETDSRDSTRTRTTSIPSSSIDDHSPPSSHTLLMHQASITSSSKKHTTSSRWRRKLRLRRRRNTNFRHHHQDPYDYSYQQQPWKRTNTFISCFGLQR